jgi:hypothetical protein
MSWTTRDNGFTAAIGFKNPRYLRATAAEPHTAQNNRGISSRPRGRNFGRFSVPQGRRAAHRSTPAAATSVSAETSKWPPHRSRQMGGLSSIVSASGRGTKDRRLIKRNTGLRVALPSQRKVDSHERACTRSGGKPIYGLLLEFTDRQTRHPFLSLRPALISGADPDALAAQDLP